VESAIVGLGTEGRGVSKREEELQDDMWLVVTEGLGNDGIFFELSCNCMGCCMLDCEDTVDELDHGSGVIPIAQVA